MRDVEKAAGFLNLFADNVSAGMDVEPIAWIRENVIDQQSARSTHIDFTLSPFLLDKALSGTGNWNSGKPFIDLTFADAAKVGKFVPGHFRKSEKLSDTGLHFIHERIFRIQKNLASHFWHIFYFRK